jgi:hypothetical protein
MAVMLFLVKHSLVKNEMREMVGCCDATGSNFVTKVPEKVFSHFHAVAVKRHGSMWD